MCPVVLIRHLTQTGASPTPFLLFLYPVFEQAAAFMRWSGDLKPGEQIY
jgi:hypothetical protein